MTDMKPCPFCGGSDLVVDSDIEAVMCDDCLGTGPSLLQQEHESHEDMVEKAIAAWNKRVEGETKETLSVV